MAGRPHEMLCALLLVFTCVNLVTVISQKSITTDEIVLIPAAYAYLTSGAPLSPVARFSYDGRGSD